ncbi:hypothetical protein [Cupriavidus campinensis]|uniref:Uncharacterized protein n=1 Tax=Cupriavidus campinensis TaxID=151783 RepID=A0ABY3EJA2_9BURK|nr:hypothetical protein [Cupriavidus campinensis]TSP11023.1 hypothetical protein FGG12_19365 [Cupriavidus campinensis]
MELTFTATKEVLRSITNFLMFVWCYYISPLAHAEHCLGENMATPKKIEKDEIEVARQRLLAAIYSELPDERFLKKQAVKQLLSTLMAARERGLSFEKISEILQASGLDLPISSLRSYYFELKTQHDLSAEAQRHARKVSETREAIQRKLLERHVQHGAAIAERYAERAAPRLVDAFALDSTPHHIQDAQLQTRDRPNKGNRVPARPASPAALNPPQAPDSGRLNSVEEGDLGAGGQTLTLPTSEANSVDRRAPTLAQVEEASLASEVRTDLAEDLELRGEFVFYVSGKPFEGTLTKKQIHLLRSVGRIVAPTKGKSSKDFVAMPGRL